MIKRMLDESEAAELRSLHERAYGRGGSLTAAELRRLHELEAPRGASAPAATEPAASEPAATGSVVTPARASTQGAEPVHTDDAWLLETMAAEPDEASEQQPLHRSPLWLAVAAAAVLLIGLGAGWMLWGWDSAQFALSSTNYEQRTELESTGDYDPGTVAVVSEQHGVTVWIAERRDGEEKCVILTTAAETQSGCGVVDQAGLAGTTASVTVPKGYELAGQSFSVYLLPSASGEIVPAVQIWDNSSSGWESQYSEAELEVIARLEAAGFEGSSLSILGYDGDTAVWTSWGTDGMCVIAESDGDIGQACAEELTADSEVSLMVHVNGVPTQYVVQNSERRGLQLTIVKLPEVVVAELDDPIEYEAG